MPLDIGRADDSANIAGAAAARHKCTVPDTSRVSIAECGLSLAGAGDACNRAVAHPGYPGPGVELAVGDTAGVNMGLLRLTALGQRIAGYRANRTAAAARNKD